MKRTINILCTLLVFHISSLSQITSFRGDIRYEHQYEDVLASGMLSTSLRRSPTLNLNLQGILVSKRILTFSLFSSLATNFTTLHTGGSTVSNTQYTWDAYNAIINALPYSPVKFDLAARDNTVDLVSEFDVLSSHGRTRQQEQRFDLSVDQIPALPTMSLRYARNRSWAPVGDPSEQVSHQLSFGMSASGGPTTAVSLSSTLNDITERYTGYHERLFTLIFSGSKEISDRHRMSISSDYSRFISYSNLSGSIGYTGIFDTKLRVSSTISGKAFSSSYATLRTVGVSQGFFYTLDENFQFGLNVDGSTGISRILSDLQHRAYVSNNWSSGATIQHIRSIGLTRIANGVSMSYQVQRYLERYLIATGALSNSIQTNIGTYSVNGDYNVSYTYSK